MSNLERQNVRKRVSWKMRRDLGFTWENVEMNMTGLVRKYGVHAVRAVYSRHKT